MNKGKVYSDATRHNLNSQVCFVVQDLNRIGEEPFAVAFSFSSGIRLFDSFMRLVECGDFEVRLPRLERGTPCLEGRCSIQLSYRRARLSLINDRRISVKVILRRTFCGR